MQYIYMSSDGLFAFIDNYKARGNKLTYFKVGYSKHPVYRGGQLSYEARRDFNIECSLSVKVEHTYPIGEDIATARKVEKYVLDKVANLARRKIGREHFLITKHNREKCYMLLPQWCAEALA